MHNSECPVIESYSNQGELLLNCRQIVLFYTAGKCAARDPWHKNSADSLSISSDSHPSSKCSMKVNCTVPQVLVVVLEKLARVAEIFEDNACRVDWPNGWGCLVTAKCRCWRAVGRKWSVFFFFFFFFFFLSFFLFWLVWLWRVLLASRTRRKSRGPQEDHTINKIDVESKREYVFVVTSLAMARATYRVVRGEVTCLCPITVSHLQQQ